MAANKRKYKTEKTRAKIKTARLLNRLQYFLLGETDPVTKQPVKLTAVEVKGIEVLLRKTLPDLTSADIFAHAEKEPKKTYEEIREEFEKRHGKEHGERLMRLYGNEITPEQFAREVLGIVEVIKPIEPVITSETRH